MTNDKADRQAATLSAVALLEAEFNGTRDSTAQAIIPDATHGEIIMMLSSAISLATIVTRQLGNLLGGDTDGVIRALRESIQDGYTTNQENTDNE